MGKEIVLMFLILLIAVLAFAQVGPASARNSLQTMGYGHYAPRRKQNVTFADTVVQQVYDKKTGDFIGQKTLIPINDKK